MDKAPIATYDPEQGDLYANGSLLIPDDSCNTLPVPVPTAPIPVEVPRPAEVPRHVEIPRPLEVSRPAEIPRPAEVPPDEGRRTLIKDSSRQKPVRGTIRLMSSLYAKLLVAATAVLVTTEILPNHFPLFFFYGYLFTFLSGGAILSILCIYISLCIQKCPGVEELEQLDDSSPESHSVLRKKTYTLPEISAFFKAGVFVFGFSTLLVIGLEIATLFTMEKTCIDQLSFVQPIIFGVFTLLQTHFLYLNSQKSIQHLGWCRHIFLMHLVATNIAIWIRLIVWETTKSWLDDRHVSLNITERFPPESFNVTAHALYTDGRHETYVSQNCIWVEQKSGIEDILRLRHCYQNTTAGAILEKAQPYILPFIAQYCLIGAAVNAILWKSCFKRVEKRTRKSNSWSPRHHDLDTIVVEKHTRAVDWKGSSKGLFLGLLVLAVGIVVLILFFVLTNNEDLKEETLFVMISVHCAILGLSFLAILFGICRVNGMCTYYYSRRLDLFWVLQNIGVVAVYVHGICALVVGLTQIKNIRYLIVFVDGALMIIQSLAQSLLFHSLSQKCCSTKCKHGGKRPGRQVVTFLAFANLVLWITESFTDHNHVSSQLQLQFFGIIPWGLISRTLLPLVMFYRFHSSVFLFETWKSAYHRPY